MTEAFKLIRSKGFQISEQQLGEICANFSIRRIAVFGSILRKDFRADSDIDFLIEFNENAAISLFDLMELELRLARIFGRAVDIVESEALKNPIRRRSILNSCEILYAA